MPESAAGPDQAGEHFRTAIQFGIEDAQLLRLKYHILRLSVVGLTDKDQKDLLELGRLSFQGSDVAKQAEKITSRRDASPLAVALAAIVGQGAPGVSGETGGRAIMFGAVLGAYAALGLPDANHDDRVAAATIGAIGGAVATSTSAFVTERLLQQPWSSYLNPED
jgi:hypothetical protein